MNGRITAPRNSFTGIPVHSAFGLGPHPVPSGFVPTLTRPAEHSPRIAEAPFQNNFLSQQRQRRQQEQENKRNESRNVGSVHLCSSSVSGKLQIPSLRLRSKPGMTIQGFERIISLRIISLSI